MKNDNPQKQFALSLVYSSNFDTRLNLGVLMTKNSELAKTGINVAKEKSCITSILVMLYKRFFLHTLSNFII